MCEKVSVRKPLMSLSLVVLTAFVATPGLAQEITEETVPPVPAEGTQGTEQAEDETTSSVVFGTGGTSLLMLVAGWLLARLLRQGAPSPALKDDSLWREVCPDPGRECHGGRRTAHPRPALREVIEQ